MPQRTARSTVGRATIVLGLAATLGACDSSQSKADKQVSAAIDQAQQIQATAQDGGAQAASKELEDAANNSDASASSRASAKAALGQVQLQMANETIRKIDRAELDLTRVVYQIAQLSQQIQTSGSVVNGYQKYDPSAARSAIEQKIAEAQGGPEKAVWFENGDSRIPTLTAVQQEIASLKSEIDQRQQQVKTLLEERSHFLDDAEQAAGKADQLKGSEAVQVFSRSSDLRRQAGSKQIDADKIQAQINTLQRGLAIAQGQESTLNEVITQLKDQQASLDAGWKEIDTQINRQEQLSGAILSGASIAPAAAPADGELADTGTIESKSAIVMKMVGDISQLRADAQTNAANAAKNFNDAAKAATQAKGELASDINNPKNAGRPQQQMWINLRKLLDPAQFQLQEAAAQRTLGSLYASEAASLTQRLSLRDVVSSALATTKLTAPAELVNDLSGAKQTALDQADSAYKTSDELYDALLNGQLSPELQVAAHVGLSLTLYGWSQTNRLAGTQQDADTHLEDAKAQYKLAADQNLPLPSMPSDLVPPPTTAPTTETAADATTQPTTETSASTGDAPTSTPAQ